ncbi:MAG: hypothetical protein KF784_11635 [Fimbriimonadaceae bacterium]|nr:hypothetical protein [Fimbriimonadaceae bacterium]
MRFFVLGGLMCAASSTLAGPTGLNLMPIADMLGHRECSLEWFATGERGIRRWPSFNAGNFGFADRVECGWENDFDGGTSLHMKIKLFDSDNGKYALSGGYMAVSKPYSQSYLVGRADVGCANIHLGWMQDGDSRGMFGVDFPIFKDYSIMADHVTGRDGSSWVGVSGPIKFLPEGFSFTASYGQPNLKGAKAQYVVWVGYGFRF